LEGLDFRKLIDQRIDIPVERKLEWMAQVCDALGHAHRHGVIHRDVKPSNLFLTESGSVKVLDFGIARLTSSRLTVAGRILGTPNYMAPEQILAGPCDGRADLFSAGVVFFELLVHKHPFRGAMIPQRIVESEPDSLFDHQSNLPPILEKVFARALAKKPDERYPTAAAFATDLRAVLDVIRRSSADATAYMDLPSDQPVAAEVVPAIAASSIEPERPPEGEDSVEWRNSEVLTLLPEFEAAVDRKDAASARRHYDRLVRVTFTDNRFTEALTACRARLEELESRPDTGSGSGSGGAWPTVGSSGTQRICAECGTGNRSAARFCIGCGANLDEATAIEPEEKLAGAGSAGAGSDTVFHPTATYAPAPQPPADLPYVARSDKSVNQVSEKLKLGSEEAGKIWAASLPWIQSNRMYLIPALVVLLIGLAAAVVSSRSAAFALEPSRAVADVSAARLDVHAAANAASKRLYSLDKGASLNILTLPASPSEEWVKVQSVSEGKAKEPGFARRSELSAMEGRDSASSLAILELTLDRGEESEQQFNDRIDALKRFAAKYPGTPEAASTLADAARDRVRQLKFQQARGLSGEPWLAAVQAAIVEASAAGKPEYEAELQAMLTPSPVTNPEQETVDAVEVKQQPTAAERFGYAQRMWKESKYNEAERAVKRVLREEPNNVDAQQLLIRIQKARDLEAP
ncbi:MAG: protein kinase, partial [Bryobacteraceae bacterium]|nr:protein kinase [Bryobacteraceae bacterium]